VLDMVRSQTVGLEEFIARWIGRFRRRPYTGPPDRLWPSAGLSAGCRPGPLCWVDLQHSPSQVSASHGHYQRHTAVTRQ